MSVSEKILEVAAEAVRTTMCDPMCCAAEVACTSMPCACAVQLARAALEAALPLHNGPRVRGSLIDSAMKEISADALANGYLLHDPSLRRILTVALNARPIREFVATADRLRASLPEHWHDDAVTDFDDARSLIAEKDTKP